MRSTLCSLSVSAFIAAAVCQLTFVPEASAQLPATRLYAVHPCGVERGKPTDVVITQGDDLEEITSLRFSHPGIQVAPKTTDQGGKPVPVANTFVITAGNDVPPGVYEVYSEGLWGVSNPRKFVVTSQPTVLEVEPNDTSDKAQKLELGQIVAGRMDQGQDVEWFSFTAKAGQKIVIDCVAERIDSKLDAVLEVHDSQRRLLTERNTVGLDPQAIFVPKADGEYRVRMHDTTFRNGQDQFYLLGIHTGPVVRFVTPAVGLAGTKQQFTVSGVNLPGSRPSTTVPGLEELDVQIDVPATDTQLQPLVGSVEAAADAFLWSLPGQGGLSTSALIGVVDSPVVVETEPANDDINTPQVTPFPVAYAGAFGRSHDMDCFQFQAQANDVVYIEAFGQRLGRAVDPYFTVDRVNVDQNGVVTLQRLAAPDDEAANALPNAFDTRTDDGLFRLQVPNELDANGAPKSIAYRVVVRDRFGAQAGDGSLTYAVRVARETHDFRLVALPAGPAVGQTWPMVLRKGDAIGLLVGVVRKDGYTGPISLRVEGLPNGVECTGATISTGQPSTTLSLRSRGDVAPGWHAGLKIIGEADVTDPALVRATDARKAQVTEAEKALPNLDKALADATQKVVAPQDAFNKAEEALKAKPDDENLKKQRDAAEAKLKEAVAARDTAQAARDAGQKRIDDSKAAVTAAEAAVVASVRKIAHPARIGTVVWTGPAPAPATARVVGGLVLSTVSEDVKFQTRLEVPKTVIEVRPSSQVLIPVKLEKRDGFDENVTLNTQGLQPPMNIEAANLTIEKGKTETLARIFVKDNSPPGTYSLWYQAAAQTPYRRNPAKADRLKAEFDQATMDATKAKEEQTAATNDKNQKTTLAQQAAEALKKAQTDKQNADKLLAEAKTRQQAAATAKTEADKVVETRTAEFKTAETTLATATTNQKTADANLEAAKKQLQAAEEALKAAGENDPNLEQLKKKVEEAKAALATNEAGAKKAKQAVDDATQALTAAKTSLEAAAKVQTEKVQPLKAEDEKLKVATDAATKAETEQTAKVTANEEATKAKTTAEQLEQAAIAKATAAENTRKAAEQKSNEAAKQAEAKNLNYTPPTDSITLIVKPSPFKLGPNVASGGQLKRGTTLEVKVAVTRQNGYAGPVVLTLPGPPLSTGITAPEVTVPADQNEGVLTITAAGDATVGDVLHLVVRAKCEFDGPATVDAPIQVKVIE